MPSTPAQKRRPVPPPISIPPLLPQRMVPGPNAFAIAAKAKQDAAEMNEKRVSNNSSVTPPLDATHSLRPGSQQSQKDSRSTARGSTRTTFTQIMEAARGSSPRKSDSHSSTMSQHTKSTGRSRHSDRSHRSTGSTQPLVQEAYAEGKKATFRNDDQAEKAKMLPWENDGFDARGTVRATVEDRAEKKSLKIMGQAQKEYDGSNPTMVAGRYTDVRLLADKAPEAIKSPKKKIFGMSFPNPIAMSLGFGKSPQIHPVPNNVPAKAAEALGIVERPPTSRRDTPSQPWRPPPRASRAETTKSAHSLPAKMTEQPDQWGRQGHQHDSMPSRLRTPSRKSQSPVKGGCQDSLPLRDHTPRRRSQSPAKVAPLKPDASFDFGAPPTPPRKDTPRDVKDKAQHGDDPASGAADPREGGVAVQMPDFMTPVKTVSANGGESPTKFCPFPAEEYARLVETQSVASAHAEMETDAVELEGDTMHPGFDMDDDAQQQQQYPAWWTEERQRRFTHVSGESPALQPAFYSPSVFSARLFDGGRPSQNTDHERLLFAIPARPKPDSQRSDPNNTSITSIDMLFQGSASEIDTGSSAGRMPNGAAQKTAHSPSKHSEPGATRAMQELHLNDQADRSAPTGSASQPLQPDASSSRLTDILDGISPAKGFPRESSAYFASAQPSPLFHMSGQQAAPPPMGPPAMGPPPSWLGTLSDGSNILTHFYMIHSHVDVLGKTFYDLVEESKVEARISAEGIRKKQDELLLALNQQFEDVKAEIGTVGRTSERVSEQSSAINGKLDKLQDYIKNEVVERLVKQTKKNADMESNIKALQGAVQELQKSVETTAKQSQHLPASQTMFAAPLNHRSQPSLTGYYDSANDAGRDNFGHRMPPIQESRNDGRFAYNNYPNGTNGNGQQAWYGRPSTAGRETVSKEESPPFAASNQYYPNNNPLQARAGNMASGYNMSGGYAGYYPGGPNETNFGYNPSTSK